jgi:hypothetical protein
MRKKKNLQKKAANHATITTIGIEKTVILQSTITCPGEDFRKKR